MTDNDKSPEIATGIAAERGDGFGWGHILSKDDCGEPVVSPDEARVYEESDPERPGIQPKRPPYTIG